MRILLTNDDGIYSDGIFAAWKELKNLGQVTVVAPDSERSSMGHAITLSHPIFVKKINRYGKFFGIGTSGTPADCVKFALAEVCDQKPDLIVSGINLGPNEGCSVIYSGTVAGAREGAINGIPSLAASLATFTNPDFTVAAKFIARIARRIPKLQIPFQTFLNVNIPNVSAQHIKGVRLTWQGMTPIHGDFIKHLDLNHKACYQMTGRVPKPPKKLGNDIYALSRNYITITPIQCNTTNDTFLKSKSLQNVKF